MRFFLKSFLINWQYIPAPGPVMGDASYHHLYYSAHADPVAELEALNKSSLKLDATVTSSNGAHHVVTDSRWESYTENDILYLIPWSDPYLLIMPKNWLRQTDRQD